MNGTAAWQIREHSGFRWLQFRPLEEIGGIERGFREMPVAEEPDFVRERPAALSGAREA